MAETPEAEMVETVAEAIHDEWATWAGSLMPELQELTFNHLPYGQWVEAGNCRCKTCERKKRWFKMFVPYSELPEETKEYDRIWARKLLAKFLPIFAAQKQKAVEDAEKKGRREVVEWFNRYRVFDGKYLIPDCDREAKLKEWGIQTETCTCHGHDGAPYLHEVDGKCPIHGHKEA
jgi:hypothetical protein